MRSWMIYFYGLWASTAMNNQLAAHFSVSMQYSTWSMTNKSTFFIRLNVFFRFSHKPLSYHPSRRCSLVQISWYFKCFFFFSIFAIACECQSIISDLLMGNLHKFVHPKNVLHHKFMSLFHRLNFSRHSIYH